MLKSVVVVPNEKTKDMGDILQIARSSARHKEHTDQNIPILSIVFDPVTKAYVCLYDWCSTPQGAEKKNQMKSASVFTGIRIYTILSPKSS